MTAETPAVAGRHASQTEEVLEVVDLYKAYGGDIVAVDRIGFSVHQGEILSVLGPSGCGKTTTLRIIAGLEEPDAGDVRLNGSSILGTPPHRRDVGLMFQDLALFPHKSVAANVAFGLRMRRVDQQEIRRRVDEILELVELPPAQFGERYPSQLSGGQRQRVALARTLVTRPSVVLFDEPLSALDRRLRDRMAMELRGLQKRLGVTSVYVTHDQETASMMSDRLVVMERGEIVQIGSPYEVYERPRTRFVGDFIGDMNFLPVRVRGVTPDSVQVDLLGRRLEVPTDGKEPVGDVHVAVRPEHLELSAEEGERTLCSCRLSDAHFTGGVFTHRVALEDGTILLSRSMRPVQPQPDGTIWLAIDPRNLQLLPSE